MLNIKLLSKNDLKKFVELWNQDYYFLTSSGYKLSYEKALKGFEEKNI